MDLDFEIYKNKKFSGLLKDIVANSEQKRAQIDICVEELRKMIKTPNDAIVVVPLLKDYLDVGVKNDEQLIKLAGIVQRLSSAQSTESDGGFGISEEERKALMVEVETTIKEMNKPIDIAT
jgi:hypothetical protein